MRRYRYRTATTDLAALESTLDGLAALGYRCSVLPHPHNATLLVVLGEKEADS